MSITPDHPPPLLFLYCILNLESWREGKEKFLDVSQSVSQLGDPSARVFEVFLIVLDGVQGETLWEGGIPRAQPHS